MDFQQTEEAGIRFSTPDSIDVATALEMIRVGIVPTTELSPVGTTVMLHGDMPVVCKGEKTREEFFQRLTSIGMHLDEFEDCPADMLFEAIEAVNK